ncbi:MAG: gliding motility-associated C-terminal domain-containing protein, partial [Bacteroidetes bacterium]|nr:gliding motility-associated C-terminal domain-containing protein [Bacteroidota bacterium]
NYNISSIPYAPDPLTGGTGVTLSDDSQTGFLPIGFSFCFFGNTYTQFIIGSNNWIGFQSGETSTWVTTAIPNASGTAPKNTIMGAWQDINPGVGGTVSYALYGTAPFRRLSVSWNNVPMFSCTGQLYSSQITIYETTNIIETHIANKSLCTTWNSGNAVHGLHNSTGTLAVIVPGRNNTQWTATNESTRFTPNGTPVYTINWYILPANILIGTGPSITVTPPITPQYYYAEVLNANGCSAPLAGTNTDTVVVLAGNASVDAGAYTPICLGQATNLAATSATAISYTWTPAGSLSNPAISNPIATPGTTTTYTVSVVDGSGCTGSDTVTVAIANPIATAGPNATICSGSSTTLSATGGSAYSWSPITGLSNPAISNPVASPTTTTTYTVTVSQGALLCTSTSTVTITVNPLPVVDAGPAATICTGTTTTLSGSGAIGYAWSPAGSLSSGTISNPVSSATSTTTYTLVGTDGNGCSSTDVVIITVNPLPVVDAGLNTTICPSSTITLNGSGANSYVWSPASTLSNPAISNPVASPTVTTTYSVIGTDLNGCTKSDVVTISINPINVIAGGTATICAGVNTTLSAFGASNYLWSPASSLSNSTVSSPVANPTTTTTYMVIGTGSTGCKDTAYVTITVKPLPIIDAGAATSICIGASTTLNGSGGLSYVWSPSGSLSSSVISNPVSSALTTTTYTIVGTDGNGCSATDNVLVTVNPLPIIDAGINTSICPGASTTLTGTGGSTYVWTPAASLDNALIASPVATPPLSTTYTVIGTDVNGCSASDFVTISLSGIAVTASSASASICNGNNTALTGFGASSYSWSPASSLSSAIIATPIASPTSTTTYTVIGTAGTGCIDTAYVTVTVNPLPLTNAGSAVGICNGTTTILSASGGIGYVWTPASSLSSSTVFNPTSSATTSTTYTVVGTDVNGCSSSDTVSIIVHSLPIASAGSATSICNGSSTTLGASGGGTYLWSPSGSLSSSTISTPVATPVATTNYTVTVTSGSGCTATSSVVVTVNPVPSATASADVVICNGASTILSSGGGGTYLWSPAAGLSSTTSATPTASPSSTTFYTVTVSNGFCSDTAGVLVTVNNILSMATATTVDATCGNTDGSITAGAVTGGASPFTYSLNGGPIQASTTFSGLATGSYTLLVTDAIGCTSTQTVVVNGVLGVSASFSASPTSGSSPLTVNLTNTSNGASNYIWDFGDGTSSVFTNPSVIYNQNGSYTIILVAYNGSFACSDTATITIEVFDQAAMIVPNIFTPNGDGQNDIFVVQSVGIKELSGTIFNRWGKKDAEWSGAPTAGWDGKINGKEAPDGTYYYLIKATGFDNKEYTATGFVQLLKN